MINVRAGGESAPLFLLKLSEQGQAGRIWRLIWFNLISVFKPSLLNSFFGANLFSCCIFCESISGSVE